MIQFRRIGHRLIFAVGSVVVLGLLALVVTYAARQERVMTQEVEHALARVSESVEEGLSALMIAGHAKTAPDFAARLKNVPNVVDYRILRPNGTEAFIDNTTVDSVNERLKDIEFTGRPGTPQPHQVLAETDPNLERVRSTAQRMFVYQTVPGGERQVTALGPIKAQAMCGKCHDPQEKVRGILKLTVSLKELDKDVEQTWWLSIGLIVVALGGIIAFVYWAAHRTVVSQIVDFSKAMETAARGDLSVRLPAASKDELGYMARSFNQMNEELIEIYTGLREERNKLHTVIHGADSGIVVTDADQNVVLVNKAAEDLLGKSEELIVREGFLNIVDDAAWMKALLASPKDESGHALLEWNGKSLSIQASTICDESGRAIGSAALLRDVTEERRIEAKLKEQSITDALTGLRNRRHFEEVLITEFKRWKRYGQPLAVMMLDVDHFKRFNDAYGHECGDRVLKAIGETLKSISGATFVPCRYGGEELVVIMPGIGQSKAVESAEAVRAKIASLSIDGLSVTVSIGVAGCPGYEVADGNALLKLADDALYVAKGKGRNQVQAARPEPVEA